MSDRLKTLILLQRKRGAPQSDRPYTLVKLDLSNGLDQAAASWQTALFST
ncbi:MAG: hypothetical protein HC879_10685 [Leptolyngbyaceae cyanobacterium SL_5_9]|nr:hypothetical protein [Leptolyngbyaceae cyanobacterium SL_5_9]NJO75743.1 hypothetical protein [Leptolyngbyaceae cyanobacterium RM1_406_9]